MSFVNPKVTTDTALFAEFEAFLNEMLPWTEDDFGGEYAWNDRIPPREHWQAEVIDFVSNQSLAWAEAELDQQAYNKDED